VSAPLVPVTVRLWVPVVAPAVVVTEKLDEPPAACGLGENEYETPLIAGVADSVTLPLKPLSATFETV
jgi:hypothetical protein